LVGGVLADFLGYRAAFFSTGLCLGLAGFIVLKWVDSDRKPLSEMPVKALDDSQQVSIKKKFRLFPDFKPIAASPILITIMIVTFGVQAANGVAIPMLPLFLKELALRVSEEAMYIGSSTGIVLGVGAAFAALAAVLVGKFALGIGYWKTLIFCLFAGAAVMIPQAFVTNMYQLMALRAISSFFIGGTSPVINAIIVVSSEKKIQGTAFGFNASISSAGAALGPMIGSAAAMLNLRAVFVVAALIFIFSASLTVWRRKRSAGEVKNEKSEENIS
jgi:MFS family permease